jgi:hypothetical protein
LVIEHIAKYSESAAKFRLLVDQPAQPASANSATGREPDLSSAGIAVGAKNTTRFGQF